MRIHGNQIKTLDLQISYDTKLDNATYDALKAFQLNTINSGSSDLANSKLRDIEASANTFFHSIANNFNMAGYNQEILSEYVPALVYTMYDGYYIYSTYNNKLEDDLQLGTEATYKQGERLSGIKPYIFYSCRYRKGSDDFVITYTLDNYITIQGTINGNGVFDSGYLLNNITISSPDLITYREVKINNDETLSEYIWDEDEVEKYDYIKVNGVKYYYTCDPNDNGKSNKCFSILNGEKLTMNDDAIELPNGKPKTRAAKEYYKNAEEFTERVLNKYNLKDLKGTHAIDEEGNAIEAMGNYDIFAFDNNISLEDPNSNFNQQRLAVIRYTIEKNLSIAIANYNNYSGGTANFLMPELKEDEWEKVVNNVSIISFLQGLNIGGKVYNGYSIITNNKNEEVVSEDSIYIITDDRKIS